MPGFESYEDALLRAKQNMQNVSLPDYDDGISSAAVYGDSEYLLPEEQEMLETFNDQQRIDRLISTGERLYNQSLIERDAREGTTFRTDAINQHNQTRSAAYNKGWEAAMNGSFELDI